MRAIISCHFAEDGRPQFPHNVDLREDAPAEHEHPDGSGNKVRPLDVVAFLKDNPQAREMGGWNEPCTLPGVPTGWTKWDALAAECNGPRATEATRALGLKHAAQGSKK